MAAGEPSGEPSAGAAGDSNPSCIDFASLTPLSPEVITNQSTINIGTIGHVAHGKTTLVRAISKTSTIRHKNEMERNITIRLGYANAKIYKCKCAPPACYKATDSRIEEMTCEKCNAKLELIRHVSFCDCPGHHYLTSTMLTGTAVMDAAVLVIAANEPCPQPQTCEHLAAVDIMNLRHLLVLQNKVDIVRQEEAAGQYAAILRYTATTAARDAPVIPISAQQEYNIDYVLEYLVNAIPVPMRDYQAPPRMTIIRSFDVNLPGEDVRNLKGGVAGGTILEGCFRVGDEVEVRPGMLDQRGGRRVWRVLRARIVEMRADKNELQFAVPGGLIAVRTTLDPRLTRADRLAGQIMGRPGTLPETYIQVTVSFQLFKVLFGVQESTTEVSNLKVGEILRVNAGPRSVVAHVATLEGSYALLKLAEPVCASIGDRIALSRKPEKAWRLIGWGRVLQGVRVDLAV